MRSTLARSERMSEPAVFFDGVTASRYTVAVAAVDGGLRLTLADPPDAPWDQWVGASELTRIDDGHGPVRLGRAGQPGWRLTLPADADPAIMAMVPVRQRYGRWIDKVGLGKAAAACAVIAAGVVLAGHVAPAYIAPLVPRSWEHNLGSTMFGNFGDNRCTSPDGDAVLRRLVARIDPAALQGPYPVEIHALDVDIFNAAALPGGYIVVFKGAIDEADGDAMAGVVAHELAHIHRRHVTQSLVRELGIGALVRLFAGGVGANAEQLVALSFTRANEAQADADARVMLARANISPMPTARLFAKLGKDEGRVAANIQFLNSHPMSQDRARAFAAAFDPHRAYQPAMSVQEHAALVMACRPKGSVKPIHVL